MPRLQLTDEAVDQSWDILRICRTRPPASWEDAFKDADPELVTISQTLEREEKKDGTFYPYKRDLFRAFECTPLPTVKVCIVGQDPYYQTIGNGLPKAVGLSFSVRAGDEIPSSLKNIYKELASSVIGFTVPNHGDLTYWATQGVFLLNSCLTVAPGRAKSHGNLWRPFIKKVLKLLCRERPNTIFLLWGAVAQEISEFLPGSAIVLKAPHPSGRSANMGFFGCGHFRETNERLIAMGEKPIDWKIPSVGEYVPSPPTSLSQLKGSVPNTRTQLVTLS